MVGLPIPLVRMTHALKLIFVLIDILNTYHLGEYVSRRVHKTYCNNSGFIGVGCSRTGKQANREVLSNTDRPRALSEL